MDQQQVFDTLAQERVYQDKKWGNIQANPHEVGAWLLLVQSHVQMAMAAWVGSTDNTAALDQLREALAIGVACAEQHGLPERKV